MLCAYLYYIFVTTRGLRYFANVHGQRTSCDAVFFRNESTPFALSNIKFVKNVLPSGTEDRLNHQKCQYTYRCLGEVFFFYFFLTLVASTLYTHAYEYYTCNAVQNFSYTHVHIYIVYNICIIYITRTANVNLLCERRNPAVDASKPLRTS